MAYLTTYWDVVEKAPLLKDPDTNELPVKTRGQIRAAILEISAQVEAALKLFYTNLTTTPWAKPAIPLFLSDPDSDLLSLATVHAAAVTETILISFTSTTAFTITGDVNGAIGTGDKTTDFTSTVIDIPAAAWVGTFKAGDKFIIRVYNTEPLIENIVARLATASLLSSVFIDQVPNQSGMVEDLERSGRRDLNNLLDGDMVLQKDPIKLNLDPESAPYDITSLGEDTTDYAT